MYMVQRLQRRDERLINAICESLKTAYDSSISRFFILQDDSYKRFFYSTLDHPAYATYYCYDSMSGVLHGFACFQIVEDIIFLKHIVVDNRFRGTKVGTTLLYNSIQIIRNETEGKLNFFQLHVFERNTKALSWYLSIGMEILDCSYWYDLYPTLLPLLNNHQTDSYDLALEFDFFGFAQVKYGDLNVGTIINQKALIIKDAKVLERLYILPDFIKVHHIESVGLISSQSYEHYTLVDKSLLLNMPIHQLELAK